MIHSPFLFPSAYVLPHVKSIGGTPQVIHEIKLCDQPNLNMPELELDRLIHRVIIGPCMYPQQVGFALQTALAEGGVVNPQDRIRLSDIPLRQRG